MHEKLVEYMFLRKVFKVTEVPGFIQRTFHFHSDYEGLSTMSSWHFLEKHWQAEWWRGLLKLKLVRLEKCILSKIMMSVHSKYFLVKGASGQVREGHRDNSNINVICSTLPWEQVPLKVMGLRCLMFWRWAWSQVKSTLSLAGVSGHLSINISTLPECFYNIIVVDSITISCTKTPITKTGIEDSTQTIYYTYFSSTIPSWTFYLTDVILTAAHVPPSCGWGHQTYVMRSLLPRLLPWSHTKTGHLDTLTVLHFCHRPTAANCFIWQRAR